ncbi:MAG TPA: FAD-dependent oxidoreductase [Novosphingobium sp.]|nr:FAD-dependent oxidoreductase [Novosphingobium sp.]
MVNVGTLKHVNTPFRIGNVEVKNRVVRPAHQTYLPDMGNVSEELIAYHEARAIGGVGMTIIETMGVHPTSPGTIWGFHPDMPNSYPPMMDRLHKHGMKVFQQLWHAGHNTTTLDGSVSWSASAVPGFSNDVLPRAMTKAMIDEAIEGYATTARNCELWGADGVEVHCAHGYLPAQFLSSAINFREDEYGGSFENRVRFMIEVLTAVRQAVSSNFAMCVRLSPEGIVGGLESNELHRVAELIESKGLADVFSLSLGNYQTTRKIIGGMHEPMGYELPTSLPIRQGLKTPTIMIGRIRTLEEADQLIRNGDCDLVAMNRATIADPDLVRKTLEGHPERVRPCIACNQGCAGFEFGRVIGCAINPGTGRETFLGDGRFKPVETPKKVLVIGGGPAGLEAARVAATRGHKVTLAEAQPRLGGNINLAAMAPTRAGMRDVIVWLEEEVYRLGVEVLLSTYMDADDVAELAPDAVILATGARPRLDGIQTSNPGEPIVGIDQPHVVSSDGLFSGELRDLGKSAVVIDDVGHYEAVATADYLVSQGLSVTYVTRHPAFAHRCDRFLMNEAALTRLNRGNFQYRTRSRAIEIEKDGVIVGPIFSPPESNVTEKFAADTVVFVSLNMPNRELGDELIERGIETHIVGDAHAPQFLSFATFRGHSAAAAI